jgi:hypothetical protein
MTVLAQLLIAAALAATAVIYGTDVFAAIVLRPALAHVDDRTLTGATGYMHDYADRRLPVPGAIGLAATVSGTAVAALAGHPGAVVAGGAAVLAMAVWLLIYRSVSAPVNRRSPPPPTTDASRVTHGPCSGNGTASSTPGRRCRPQPSRPYAPRSSFRDEKAGAGSRIPEPPANMPRRMLRQLGRQRQGCSSGTASHGKPARTGSLP